VQVGSPEESVDVLSQPLQPPKVDPAATTAVNVTCWPVANEAVLPLAQGELQLIPAGLLVMVPVPFPAVDTVRLWVGLNAACTLRSPVIVTVQVGSPEESVDVLSQPLQPPDTDPAPATSVNVTSCPEAKEAVLPSAQGELQSIPAGLLVIVPMPFPAVDTVSEWLGATLNVACTLRSPFMVSVHTGSPEELVDVLSQPRQPPKTDPAAAAAVNTKPCPAGTEEVTVQGELQLPTDGKL
jgi:hypothetical protein